MGSATSLASPLSPLASTRARAVNAAGGALIALAFALPFLGVAAGIGSSFQAGAQTVYTLVALFSLAVVAWLATRKRSDAAKAVGRLLTGVLLCLYVSTTLARAAGEAKIAEQFLRDALAFQGTQTEKFSDLGQRFEKVNLATVLTPESITMPAGQATARATIAQYRALLAERRLLLQTYLAEYERLIATVPPGSTRDGALAGTGSNKEATAKLYTELDKSQTVLADVMVAVLEWGTAQAGRLGARDGQLLFTSQTQQAELNGLLNAISKAEAANAEVVKTASTASAKARATGVENTKMAEELLRR